MEQGKIKPGMRVQFTAIRLTSGNPVKGILKELDNEWGTVVLDHPITGLVTQKWKGEEYTFRLSLINGLKQIK